MASYASGTLEERHVGVDSLSSYYVLLFGLKGFDVGLTFLLNNRYAFYMETYRAYLSVRYTLE